MRTGMLAGLFVMLLTGFLLLFRGIRLFERLERLLKKTRFEMDQVSRRRSLEDRKKLIQLQNRHTWWTALERELNYTGIRLRCPKLTVEMFIVCNLLAGACVAVILFAQSGMAVGIMGLFMLYGGELTVLRWMRTANLRRVNGQLMKLLDFLGNYSITAGEVTGILYQVSRYMEEPLKNALESCYYEAQFTGDIGLALLSMAEKIEHPKFKELARNMEVSIRYCADFTALVAGSKRSLREYLKVAQERKGMLQEALINMGLLLGLSLIILTAVSSLVQMSVSQLLMGTLPGRIGLCVFALIGVLFIGQFHRAN